MKRVELKLKGGGSAFVDPRLVTNIHPHYADKNVAIVMLKNDSVYHVIGDTATVNAALEVEDPTQVIADATLNLYHIAAPFMRETDPVWRAMQEEYVAAMKLAGRDPKI